MGEVLLRCNAKDIVQQSGKVAQQLGRIATEPDARIPEISITGHVEATFPYIQSHLEYVLSELIHNSIIAIMNKHGGSGALPPPVEVLICEAVQHLVIRISDQGGGIAPESFPYLWTFNKGPGNSARLRNLRKVPKLAATINELQGSSYFHPKTQRFEDDMARGSGSLASLSSRPPSLRIGIGLPMSRIYAEYWAGSLAVHNLKGYGVDTFLQISKLGNQNEQIASRASVDAV